MVDICFPVIEQTRNGSLHRCAFPKYSVTGEQTSDKKPVSSSTPRCTTRRTSDSSAQNSKIVNFEEIKDYRLFETRARIITRSILGPASPLHRREDSDSGYAKAHLSNKV